MHLTVSIYVSLDTHAFFILFLFIHLWINWNWNIIGMLWVCDSSGYKAMWILGKSFCSRKLQNSLICPDWLPSYDLFTVLKLLSCASSGENQKFSLFSIVHNTLVWTVTFLRLVKVFLYVEWVKFYIDNITNFTLFQILAVQVSVTCWTVCWCFLHSRTVFFVWVWIKMVLIRQKQQGFH